MKIYLDDIRKAPAGFKLVTDYYECIELLKKNKGNIEILSLDHDLGQIKSGYDVTKWMVENEVYADSIYLHTANPVGRDNMCQLLERYKPEYVKLYNFPMRLT